MKRVFICLIALALLFAATACFKEPQVPVKPIEQTEPVTKKEPVSLPDAAQKQLAGLHSADFSGAEFRIATDDASLIMPPNSTNLINRRLYERNAAVEEKYHVHLTLTPESGYSMIYDRVRTEALAGASYCDMVLLRSDRVQYLVSDGALIDLNTIPYLDLSAPYYFSSSIASATLGGITYAAAGDFTYDPSNAFVMYFNQFLLEKADLPDLYSLVMSGQWDLDTFLFYCEELYALDRVDGYRVYGCASSYSKEELLDVFWAGSNGKLMDTSGHPRLVYRNQTTDIWMDFTNEILFRSPTYFSSQGTAVENFKSNRILFLIAPLSEMDDILTDTMEWGVVPIPKLSADQPRYSAYTGSTYQMAAFPKGIPDLSFSGSVANALFAATYEASVNHYITRLINTVLPDPNCGYSIREAIRSPYFDSAYFFGKIYTPVSAATYTIFYRVMSAGNSYDELYTRNSRQFEQFLEANGL